MSFSLRLLSDSDIPYLQRIYDASPQVFQRLLRAPAAPDQAARDFVDALQSPGRFQFGVLYDDDLIGMVDCKLDDEEEGVASIGLILLPPPYNDPEITGLALRVLERWLGAEYGVRRIEVGALAHVPAEVSFWEGQGYALTGGQYRRDLPGYAPRFLVLAKELA
jgi:RimJ/RimL family protein N-acetyltransferase